MSAPASAPPESRSEHQQLYDTYRSTFKGDPHPIEPALMRERYGRLLRRNLAPGIDLGAGSGEFIEWLSVEGVNGVWGIDISSEQVAAAARLGRDVRHGDIETMLRSVPDGSLQALFARDVLEHLDKPAVFHLAAEASRTLASGGLFFVQVPNGYAVRSETVWAGDFTHVTLFSEDSLAQVMRSAGFSLLDVWGITPGKLTPLRLVRHLGWTLIKSLYMLVDIVESGRRVRVYERVLCASFQKQ